MKEGEIHGPPTSQFLRSILIGIGLSAVTRAMCPRERSVVAKALKCIWKELKSSKSEEKRRECGRCVEYKMNDFDNELRYQ